MRTPRIATVLVFVVVSGVLASPVEADPFVIFQSAPLGPDVRGGDLSATPADETQFVGVRFHVNSAVEVTHVAARVCCSGPGSTFAALVRLTHAADFPDTEDLSSSDVIATTVLPTADVFQPAVVAAPVRVTLARGWYALVLGAGLFGTEFGTGLFDGPGQANSSSWIFTARPVGQWGDDPERPFEYVAVFGREASPTPEPTTVSLVSIGIVSGFCVKYRKRRRLWMDWHLHN